jgi:hypothetical protein
MNRPPMQEEDDGFGDFRAKVKGLPREQRMAELKKMEDAVLENLRSNMLADLYAEDQPAPGPPQPGTQPAPRQPPQGSGRVPPDVSMGVKPSYSDGTPLQDWQLQEMEENGLSVEEYERQPPYTSPMKKGSMTGKPYPSEEEWGGGDDFYSNLHRWEEDNGVPRGMKYKSPEYHKFVQDYQAKNKFGGTPDLRPSDTGGGKGYPSGAIIDDEEPLAFGDVATPTKMPQQPPRGHGQVPPDVSVGARQRTGSDSEKYPWILEEEAKLDAIRQRRGDSEPPEMQNYATNPAWLEWRYADATPEEIQAEYDVLKPQVDAEEPNSSDGYLGAKQLVEFLAGKLKGRAQPPAPRAQGMFGRPPGGIGANRMMLEQ